MSPSTRSDAQRNRAHLLEVARDAFAVDTPSLEAIARAAGVGIGTLYRHFPTREDLVEAVYETELAEVVASAERLRTQHPADVALRRWMDRYAEFIAAKRGIIDTLRAGWATGRLATPSTRQVVTGLIGDLIAAGAEQGLLRADVEPDDVTGMLLGVFQSTGPSGTPEQVGRMLDLLVDALRATPPGSPVHTSPGHPRRLAIETSST